jgi:hypothetical protein
MREPYETLLGHYRNHVLLWPFLDGDVPDFVGIAAADPLGWLSTGELLVLHVALAFWNGDRTAKVADLAVLDDENLHRVVRALEYTCGVRQ